MDGFDPNRKKASQPFRWLPQIDQVLVVGMMHGPNGTREAVKKVRQLAPELVPAQVWRRMRLLREKGCAQRVSPVDWSEDVIEILRDGYRSGGRKKAEAIKIVRARYPGLPGYVVSSFARRQGWLRGEQTKKSKGRRPWTKEEDHELFVRAGYEPVKLIAKKLRRSEQSVRFRLKGLAISARNTDDWSLRRLQQTLHVSYRRLRHFVGSGFLRVRDPRVSTVTLLHFLQKFGSTLQPTKQDITVGLSKEAGHSWGRVAELLGVTIAKIGEWIANGALKVVDASVTDRAFEAFCRQHTSELNLKLMDPDVAQWLIEEYGVQITPPQPISPRTFFQKQALIVRSCPKCRRQIRGNVYFGHVPACRKATLHGDAARSEVVQQAG
jgi:hypothetical protein